MPLSEMVSIGSNAKEIKKAPKKTNTTILKKNETQ